MTSVEQLEMRSEIESAKLGVAEDFGWWVAGFAAYAAYLKWDSLWLAAAVVAGGYFAVTYTYRKREKLASDAYHQAAFGNSQSTGKDAA